MQVIPNVPTPRPTAENNEKYQGLMRIANGLAGPGVTLKQQIEKIKKDVKDDADAWDAQYAETHTADGVAKVHSALFNEAEMAKRKDEERKKQEKTIKDNLDKVDDNNKKTNSVSHESELDSQIQKPINASREQFIFQCKS